MTRILVIDNYDSFVYNLVQYVGQLGAEPVVRRHDAIDVHGVDALAPDGILVSPGPGRPEDAGVSAALVAHVAGRIPVLGVCLGHQVIGAVFGAQVVRASVMHGKTSSVNHDGRGVFRGLPDPFVATRYHSLVVAGEGFPDTLDVTARAADGTIMGLRHRRFDVEGVQFHPEAVMTEHGHRMIANWLMTCGFDADPEAGPSLELPPIVRAGRGRA